MNPSSKKLLLSPIFLSALILSTAIVGYAAILVNRPFSNTVTLSALGDIKLYSDPACTVPLSSITWGSYIADQSKDVTVYIKNTGNVNCYLSWQVDVNDNAWQIRTDVIVGHDVQVRNWLIPNYSWMLHASPIESSQLTPHYSTVLAPSLSMNIVFSLKVGSLATVGVEMGFSIIIAASDTNT